MVEHLKNGWNRLADKEKARYQKWGMIFVGVCLLVFLFSFQEEAEKPAQRQNELISITPVNHFDAESFRQDLHYKQKKQIEQQNTAQKAQEDRIEQLSDLLIQLKQQLDKTDSELEINAGQETVKSDQPASKYPSPGFVSVYPPMASAAENTMISVQPRLIGAITKALFSQDSDKQEKVVRRKVFILPPGFFSARTMEGIEVGSGFNASANPQPLLLRIQTPATLPNSLKSNIKGCFVVANATGSLSKERIDFRTDTLNCISKDKKSILTAHIRGHITDIDGKQGLSARVVSKTGHALGYAFLAKFVEGMGSGYLSKFPSASSGINLLTGQQESSTLTNKQIVQSGIGAGIGSSSAMLSEYYLDIIKQLSPVLETGAGREVTVVMTAQAKLISQPIQTTE
jgi:conjugal transfer pilus assembly protein TraB